MKAALALSILTMLLMGAALRSAEAHPAPYIRLGFGGNQLLMAEANDAIETEVGWAEDGGVPVSAQVVGPGYGPALSAGLWLFPALRVGATYGYQRSKVTHEYRQSGFVYDNEYQFEITEIGFEAAVRLPQWAGLTFGGQVAEGRGEAGQAYAVENIHGEYHEDLAARGRPAPTRCSSASTMRPRRASPATSSRAMPGAISASCPARGRSTTTARSTTSRS